MIGALPPWRGVAPYTQSLVEHLEALDDVELEFLDFAALYPGWLYPGGRPDRDGARPRLVRTRIRRMLAWWNPLGWLRAGLTLRGRVVHAQWWSFVLAPVYITALALARLRGRCVVLTLHNVQPHEQRAWRRWLNSCVLHFGHHFIVHSERNARALIEGYPAATGRVSVVPMGLHALSGPSPAKAEARAELDLPVDRPALLAFGHIRAYKGLDVLLRGFRLLLDAGQEAVLLIAGQPWGSFAPYERLIEELRLGEHVRTWLEFVPDEQAAQLFAAADLAVFPYTHFDAQSAVATLALGAGLPVVVTDVGGLLELAADERAVVPPNDPEALARAMQRVLSDDALRERLAAGSRARAAELDWHAIARRTAELYRRLASA